ncbi:MAG: hypothetical protein KC646_09495 [Candidatus Cloacimonetes bacterium]|nr:hypothetical protein [Candidatus Cloacimonadota bacterium]
MSKFSKLIKFALTAVAVMNLNYANDITNDVSKVMDQSWVVRDLSTKSGSSKEARTEYMGQMNSFVKTSRSLATELIKNNDIEKFSTYYKTLDVAGKESLEFVVEAIIEKGFHAENRIEINAQDYFPGYGYGKPGYVYRRGEETKREFLYAYWKDEEIEEITNFEKELLIDIKLVAKLKLAIPELIEGVKAEVDIDGSIHEVVKIKFSKKVTLKTKQKRKLGVERVYFKLFEAKKKFWGDLNWKYVGKTFQNDTMPTGEAVITEASVK